jgi:hypothetical protein
MLVKKRPYYVSDIIYRQEHFLELRIFPYRPYSRHPALYIKKEIFISFYIFNVNHIHWNNHMTNPRHPSLRSKSVKDYFCFVAKSYGKYFYVLYTYRITFSQFLLKIRNMPMIMQTLMKPLPSFYLPTHHS